MRISIAKKDRAFAVIIALVAVTVLTMMAGLFAYAMKIGRASCRERVLVAV